MASPRLPPPGQQTRSPGVGHGDKRYPGGRSSRSNQRPPDLSPRTGLRCPPEQGCRCPLLRLEELQKALQRSRSSRGHPLATTLGPSLRVSPCPLSEPAGPCSYSCAPRQKLRSRYTKRARQKGQPPFKGPFVKGFFSSVSLALSF